jgi:hypothetical protein
MDCFFPPLTSVGSGASSIEPVSASSSMCNAMKPVEKKEIHLWGKGVLAQLRKCGGVERYTRSGSEMIKNRMGRVVEGKRMGGADYHPRNRTANYVISKDNGKPSYIDSRYSEDTYPTDAITDSSASEEEYDGYTSEWTAKTNASEWTTKTTETEKKSYVSWLNNSKDQTSHKNGKQTDHISPSQNDVLSPTSSVGAVKISAKDRFDYIRSKNRHQFAVNTAQRDPPSDKTMMTSRSIRAADAGSILFKSVHRRKNELATQIIKRRQKTPAFSQFGYEP